MKLIRPFRGLRARPDAAAEVAAPPYDVMNSAEAAELAEGKPHSFLHVSRPEIDLETGIDLHDPRCYAKAAENFERLIQDGYLIRDQAPCLYLYRLTFEGRSQLGIAAEVSVDAYLDGRVKKHEFTRPDKEDDRTRHVEAINANSGPVFLVYKNQAELEAQLTSWLDSHAAVVDMTANDGVRHEFWVLDDADACGRVVAAIDDLGALYIADGHHRSAAGSRVCQARREAGETDPEVPHQAFLGILFPDSQVRVYDYNRVVKDLNGLSGDAFLDVVRERFEVEAVDRQVRPERAGQFGVYMAGQWYRLTVPANEVPSDPVAKLDVSMLADRLLEPVLGITDPRRDKRIDFVGGIRGLGELERRVDSGECAVAFSLYPTGLDDLMAVADAGEVMPPKSTWFEPKLRDGLIVQMLD